MASAQDFWFADYAPVLSLAYSSRILESSNVALFAAADDVRAANSRQSNRHGGALLANKTDPLGVVMINQALRSHFKATFLDSCICSVIAEIELPSTIPSNAFVASWEFCPVDRTGVT